MGQKIGILGLGALGRAIAAAADAAGTEVIAWSRSERSRQRGPRGEGDLALPRGIQIRDDPCQVVDTAKTVFFALPGAAMEGVVEAVASHGRGDHFWIHGTKGVSTDGLLMHELFRRHTCVQQIAALGGPVLASDLARRASDGLVVASRFDCVVRALGARLFANGRRLSSTRDITGVEVAGALRNVSSVAVGMCHGLGEASRSAVLARSLVESARFGVSLGATPQTFVGIAGVGDLIARRDATSSRNFRLGERCARGESPSEDEGAAEGAITARAIATRAAELGVEMPLTTGVSAVLAGQVGSREMIASVLASDPGLRAGDSLV